MIETSSGTFAGGLILKTLCLFLAVIFAVACQSSSETAQDAISQLSSPTSFTISGTGTGQSGGNQYVFATSAGTIDASGNFVAASFADPYLPLGVYSSGAYTDQIAAGSCSSIPNLAASVSGGSGNLISTELSATGCTDQAQINILLDTSQIFDNAGFSGTDVISLSVIVDLAPIVSVVATGNTLANGTGTTYGTAGQFSIASDNSIVVTFSKSLTGGTFNATLTGCAATLGTGALVSGSSTQVVWPVTGFGGFSSGATCTLNVSGVTDAPGNPDDPSDPNIAMTVTFE